MGANARLVTTRLHKAQKINIPIRKGAAADGAEGKMVLGAVTTPTSQNNMNTVPHASMSRGVGPSSACPHHDLPRGLVISGVFCRLLPLLAGEHA